MTTQEYIDLFIAEQQLNDNSLAKYRLVLERVIFRWVVNTGRNPKALSKSDAVQFRKSLLDRKLAIHTICMYLTVLRRFFMWMEENDYYENIAKGIRNPRRTRLEFKRRPLSLDDIRRLLTSIDRSNAKGRRDYAMIRLMFSLGLRTIEIERLRIGDLVDRPDGHVLMVHGKGRIEKIEKHLGDEAYHAIMEMMQDRFDIDNDSPLFSNTAARKPNLPITRIYISQLIKEYLRGIGIDDKAYTAHSLRHSVATELARKGFRIEELKFFMRHQSIKETNIYLKLIERDEKASRELTTVADHLL
jgi:site-specific recombinase XerD